MAEHFDLYIDVANNRAVQSRESSTAVNLPTFVYGDTMPWRIRLLVPTGQFDPPYDFIPNTGLTLEMAIGIRGAGSYLTQQFTWALSGDTSDPYFEASLSMNTGAIQTAIGSSATLAATFQIRKVDSLVPTTVLLKDITIQAAIISNATLSVPPGATAATVEGVLAMLAHLQCQDITMVSPDGTRHRQLGVQNDGTPTDSIS